MSLFQWNQIGLWCALPALSKGGMPLGGWLRGLHARAHVDTVLEHVPFARAHSTRSSLLCLEFLVLFQRFRLNG